MIKFGNLSKDEKQAFNEVLKKNMEKPVKEQQIQIWPDDDDELAKCYLGGKTWAK